jgi:hypothetical protein
MKRPRQGCFSCFNDFEIYDSGLSKIDLPVIVTN